MSKDLKNKMLADLEKSGFASEMRAIKIFQNSGWHCDGGRNFMDKDQNISRDSDIAAHYVHRYSKNDMQQIECWYFIAGEVKKSEKPWVVFARKLKHPFTQEAWGNLTFRDGFLLEPHTISDDLTKLSLRDELRWEGYGIHESFKSPDNPSQGYKAIVSAIKATEDVVETNGSIAKKINAHEKNDIKCILMFGKPVVILDGQLFSAELNEMNDIELNEISFAPLKVNFETTAYTHGCYYVDVVTLEGLASYLGKSKDRHSHIFKALTEKTIEAYRIKQQPNKLLKRDAAKSPHAP
jgi:hypothetical protein